ncbi:unnamed protein product [Brassica rapa subsp. narinosa]
MIVGPEKCIRILQRNVPNHDLSTLAVGIFNVCIGNDKETSKLFQQFAANHYDLHSDAIVGLGADLEWRLTSFGAPYMNRYGASFKFPDDEVIKSPSCLYGHDYTDFIYVILDVICFLSYSLSIRKPLVFVYLKYSSMLSVFSLFVYLKYSYTLSIRQLINGIIRIPSVFVYCQYSYTVSIRILSVFV